MVEFYFEIIIRIAVFLYALWLGGIATTIYNRIPNDIPIGPSQKPRCNNCKKEIKFKYFFPVLGYFFSNGKCVHCGMKIPKVYLLIELSVLFYNLVLSLNFNMFDEKFISASLYGSFIVVLMFINMTKKQIKTHLIWMLVAFILAYLGYNYHLPRVIELFISCMSGFFALLILKKYIQFSKNEFQLCCILISSFDNKISFIYLLISILLRIICLVFNNINLDKFFKKINIVFITLTLALILTLID